MLKKVLLKWLPLGATIIVMAGLVYWAVQQNYRISANDPQIQVAEDLATALSQGQAQPTAIVPPNPTVPMSSSLATFVVIYDDSGKPIGSSVALDGKMPVPPLGVFDTVKKRGETRFTWQPQKDVRAAAVVTHYSSQQGSGFVLAGRSLKEVEARIKMLTLGTGLATLAALILSFLLTWLMVKMLPSSGNTIVAEEVTTIINP